MVIVMKLKSMNQYMNKQKMDSAPELHKLFNQDSAPFKLPTPRELIKEKLTWRKWFEKELKDMITPHDEDDETLELCELIGISWNDLDISVIDTYMEDKKTKGVSRTLTFKDFN